MGGQPGQGGLTGKPSSDEYSGTQGPGGDLGRGMEAKEDQARLRSDSGLGVRMGGRRSW